MLINCIACSPQGDSNEVVLRSALSRDAAGKRIKLDLSLNAIARGKGMARQLAPLIEYSGADLDFGAVGDASFLPTGTLAVVDRLAKQVYLLHENDNAARKFGHAGKGPGEFADPWAVTTIGSDVLVWQNVGLSAGSATFILFDSAGVFKNSVPRPVAGDWWNPVMREPSLKIHDLQNSPEDITRRLRPAGDSGFYHIIQPNEHVALRDDAAFDLNAPPAYVIRYNLELQVEDTVAVLRSPSFTPGPTIAGARREFSQNLFASWPLYATGDGWIAFAHGDSAVINVQRLSGTGERTLVNWPVEQHEITEQDRITANEWLLEIAFRQSAEFEDYWNSLPKARRQALFDEQMNERLHFADFAPNITGLFGAGACLFATGFNPNDNADAVSQTIVAVNVESGDATILRLADNGETLRAFSSERIATTRRDDYGEWYVRVYEHEVDCAGSQPQ